MDKPRCQAVLLTRTSRNSHKYSGRDIRCTYGVKENTNFCGNHYMLAEIIHGIVWKEEDGLL